MGGIVVSCSLIYRTSRMGMERGGGRVVKRVEGLHHSQEEYTGSIVTLTIS